MAVDPRELPDILSERKYQSDQITDEYTVRTDTYRDWAERKGVFDNIYSDNWEVVWPDYVRTEGLAKIPNVLRLAIEDRARLVASGRPTLAVRPEKVSDAAKMAAEKRERILSGYWYQSNVRSDIIRWAFDSMATGLAAVKVLPDYGRKPSERFPAFTRCDPRYSYPSPIFSPGPFLDDFIYSYNDKARTVARRFNAEGQLDRLTRFAKNKGVRDPSRVTVIEFYDDEYVIVVAAHLLRDKQKLSETLVYEEHGMGKCPIAVGARPSADNVYRGDFDSSYAIMNVWNRLMTLHLDSAVDHVYPMKKVWNMRNPEEWGPDAVLEMQSPDAVFEYVTSGTAPFENYQLMRQLADFADRAALMPASRSGNPDESIISAAGITATQSQMIDHVRSIQRDTLAPMLVAANELAFRADEASPDVQKEIYGYQRGHAFSEKYRAKRDIAGAYRNEVVYGFAAGLDEINANVMILQNWAQGQGLISEETAAELSPLVENPPAERKKKALEQVERAVLAGLTVQAQQGALTAAQLAEIHRQFSEEGKSLFQAVIDVVGPEAPAPLAEPPRSREPRGAPGIAGAQRGEQPNQANLPPLEELLVGSR